MADTLYEIRVTPLSQEDGGGYMATVPDLDGCVSDGETPQEAVANAMDAIAQWLQARREMGREIPVPGSASGPQTSPRTPEKLTGG
ncbi:MAG: type II toxin-antitoxin system HicB family antitoxin [Alphaproteobacteria bacterium]|nr:type II toxin-antitoxin system HicB family antitoxin [Alphaproteobacteria bacterium]